MTEKVSIVLESPQSWNDLTTALGTERGTLVYNLNLAQECLEFAASYITPAEGVESDLKRPANKLIRDIWKLTQAVAELNLKAANEE